MPAQIRPCPSCRRNFLTSTQCNPAAICAHNCSKLTCFAQQGPGPQSHILTSTGVHTSIQKGELPYTSVYKPTTPFPIEMPVYNCIQRRFFGGTWGLLQWHTNTTTNSVQPLLHDRRETAPLAQSLSAHARGQCPHRAIRASRLHAGTVVGPYRATLFTPISASSLDLLGQESVQTS